MIHQLLTTMFLISLSLFGGSGIAAEIILRESANPLGTIVRLGDVADIRTNDAAAMDRLSAIPLMPTPATGTVQHLRAKEIRDMLRAQGIAWSAHRFSGAISVKVGREGLRSKPSPTQSTKKDVTKKPVAKVEQATPVRRPPSIGFRSLNNSPSNESLVVPVNQISRRQELDIKIQVRESLEAWLASQGEAGKLIAIGEIEIEPVDIERLYNYRKRELVAEPLANTDAKAGLGKFVVSPFGGQPSYAKAELIQLEQVVTSSRMINRGETITASHLVVKGVLPEAIEKTRSPVFESIESAIGRIAKRTIRSEELLSEKNTTTPVLVLRRETVTVSTGSSGITIRMQAIAKQDGRLGDLITVETLDTGEVLQARVTGRAELAVLGGGQLNSQLAARSTLGVYR